MLSNLPQCSLSCLWFLYLNLPHWLPRSTFMRNTKGKIITLCKAYSTIILYINLQNKNIYLIFILICSKNGGCVQTTLKTSLTLIWSHQQAWQNGSNCGTSTENRGPQITLILILSNLSSFVGSERESYMKEVWRNRGLWIKQKEYESHNTSRYLYHITKRL